MSDHFISDKIYFDGSFSSKHFQSCLVTQYFTVKLKKIKNYDKKKNDRKIVLLVVRCSNRQNKLYFQAEASMKSCPECV